MKRMIAGLCLALLSGGSSLADSHSCHDTACALEVRIASVAEEKIYGLLLGAPRTGCLHVRYRVETAGQRLLGKTPTLAAGEVAMVRIGSGYARGDHVLLVIAEGCASAPLLSRRVTLRKASPDHGWRASLAGTLIEPVR